MEKLLVGKRLLIGVGRERQRSVSECELEVFVRGEWLVEIDQGNRRVVSDSRVVPKLERLAILSECSRVLRRLEELVAFLEERKRSVLRTLGHIVGPRPIGGDCGFHSCLGCRGGRWLLGRWRLGRWLLRMSPTGAEQCRPEGDPEEHGCEPLRARDQMG